MKHLAVALLLAGRCATQPCSSLRAQREAAVGVAVLFAESTCNEQTYPREAADIYNKAADEWVRQNRMTKEDP